MQAACPLWRLPRDRLWRAVEFVLTDLPQRAVWRLRLCRKWWQRRWAFILSGGGVCVLGEDCGVAVFSLCHPSSGGSGGTGGGLAFGCSGCLCCSCLATTGGSLEKMSCSMEKNSNKVEVYGPRISTALCIRYIFAKVLLPMCCHIERSFGGTNFYSHHLSSSPDTDGRFYPLRSHAALA